MSKHSPKSLNKTPFYGSPHPREGNLPGKHTCLMHFYERMLFLTSRQRFLMVLRCSWVSWPKNDTERLWNHLKKQVLEPSCTVLVPPSPCLLANYITLLANHITLPGREIPGAGRVITLPKGHHPVLSKSLNTVTLVHQKWQRIPRCDFQDTDCYLRQGDGP